MGVSILVFTSKTCGPCRAYKPLLEGYAEKFKDVCTITVVPTETDEGIALATQHKVRSVPTTVFVSGDVSKSVHGVITEDKFRDTLLELTGGN